MKSLCTLFHKFTLNTDNLFKLHNNHEFAQLSRLNNEVAFYNSQLHSHLFGEIICNFPFPNVGNYVFIPIPNPKSWEFDFSFPFPIPKFGNYIFYSHSQSQQLGKGWAISHSQSQMGKQSFPLMPEYLWGHRIHVECKSKSWKTV